MSFGIIIQARTSSTRLRDKIILPFFKNQTILEIMIRNLKPCQIPIYVATTTNPRDEIICSICKNMEIPFYRGSEHNVLDRFIKTAEHFKIKTIIRVCSDNPFMSYYFISQLVNYYKKCKPTPDYYSFTLDGSKPAIQEHIGAFAEITNLKALKTIPDNKLYQEHVTNYIYTHPDKYNILLVHAPYYIYNHPSKHKIRLTVDTNDDFDLMKKLYEDLRDFYGCDFIFPEIIECVTKNNYIEKMEKLIKNNPK